MKTKKSENGEMWWWSKSIEMSKDDQYIFGGKNKSGYM